MTGDHQMSRHTVSIDVLEEKAVEEKDLKMSKEDRIFADRLVSQMTVAKNTRNAA